MEDFQDQWRAEAARCWSPGVDGVVPGYIADMMPRGREYDPLSLMYFDTDTPTPPSDPRPWLRRQGDPAMDPPPPANVQDIRLEDIVRATRFFQKESNANQRSGALLDLCCGDAFIGRRLCKAGHFERVYGLDVDWRALEMGRSLAERERVNPEDGLMLMRGDAQALPFQDNRVDAIWWGMGMHKVQDAQAALDALFPVLRPGGQLVATIGAVAPIMTIPGKFMPADVQHMATRAGFKVVSCDQPRPGCTVLEAIKE